MRELVLQNWLPSRACTLAIVIVLLLGTLPPGVAAIEPATAGEIAKRVSIGPADGFDYLLAAYPSVGTINQPRTVFMHQTVGCVPNDAALDTSAMEANGLVVLRYRPRLGVICAGVVPPKLLRFEFLISPTKVGFVRIRDEKSGSEITIQTVAASPASKFDVNGMWFDAATNGSGIALHHRRSTTDIAFGTWFLYSNNGESRWVSFQSTNWQQDGSVLEGLLIETRGGWRVS